MVTIRTYREDDREALRGLVLALHEVVRPLDADLAPGETILDAHFDHLLRRQAQTQGTILVAEAGGHLIGYAVRLRSGDAGRGRRAPDVVKRSSPSSM